MTEDRSRDVSRALTEVRTVLSRAETALDTLVMYQRRGYHIDPDHEDMMTALEKAIDGLRRWRKAGKGRKR